MFIGELVQLCLFSLNYIVAMNAILIDAHVLLLV